MYPGTVEVSLYVGPPAGSSVLTMYEMHIEGDRHLYADGAATVVFIDLAKQKPMRIPPDIRAKLQ